MPKKLPQELKEECLRLREEECLSYKEIMTKTGVSKGTLSGWLSGTKLPEDTLKAKASPIPTPRRKDRLPTSELWGTLTQHHLTTSQTAKVSEALVSLRLLSRGFDVFGSSFDGDKADWVVENPSGKLFKIQVKTAKDPLTPHGLPVVSLRSSSSKKRYKSGDFDFVVGVDLRTEACYVWSWEEVSHLKSAVTISDMAFEAWSKLL